LRQRGGGSIVFVASIAGLHPMPVFLFHFALYSGKQQILL
jgi:hypothetical protein